MALRTYHRRVQETRQSRTDVSGRTVWEAVLEFIRESEPVSGSEVQRRFVHDATPGGGFRSPSRPGELGGSCVSLGARGRRGVSRSRRG